MTAATTADSMASSSRSSWLAPVLRAVPALGVGIAITFTADHSSGLGLLMLSIFGIGSAAALLGASTTMPRTDSTRGLYCALGVTALVVGGLALAALLALESLGPVAALPVLLLLVGGYAVIGGALELVWGLRHRGASAYSRDAITIGIGTLALAVLLALVSDPVSAVGFFGAYAVMLGVLLIIIGLSAAGSAPSKEPTDS